MTDGRAATVRTFVRRWSGAIRRPEADRSGDLPLRRNASLVPVASIAGRSLVTVVAIMTFLCALAAGAGLLIAGASRDWQRAVSSEVTIQVRPIGGHDTDAEVQKAADLARATPGIDSVEVYGKKTRKSCSSRGSGPASTSTNCPSPACWPSN